MLNSGRRSSNMMKSRFDCSSRGSLLIAAVSMKNKIVARKRSCLDNDLMVQTEVIRLKRWGFLEDESPVKSTSSSPCSQTYEDDSASYAFSVSSPFEASIYVCSCIMDSSLWNIRSWKDDNRQPVRVNVQSTQQTANSTQLSSQLCAKEWPHSTQPTTHHSTQLTTHNSFCAAHSTRRNVYVSTFNFYPLFIFLLSSTFLFFTFVHFFRRNFETNNYFCFYYCFFTCIH